MGSLKNQDQEIDRNQEKLSSQNLRKVLPQEQPDKGAAALGSGGHLSHSHHHPEIWLLLPLG